MNYFEQPWAFKGLHKTWEDPNPQNDMHRRMFEKGDKVECPLCHGYGQCHMSENSTFPHIVCNQCNGWGFVTKGSVHETCIHDMKHVAKTGNCLNVYACSKCGLRHEVDSSG